MNGSSAFETDRHQLLRQRAGGLGYRHGGHARGQPAVRRLLVHLRHHRACYGGQHRSDGDGQRGVDGRLRRRRQSHLAGGQHRRQVAGAVDGIGGTVTGGTNDFQNIYSYDDLNQMMDVAQSVQTPPTGKRPTP